jgi:hypothetical protein
MQDKLIPLIPYLQMYEFEGLLFSSPADMAYILQNENIKNWAENILKKFNGNPELINNSSQTAPSKRLIVTPYRKVTHGPSRYAEGDVLKNVNESILKIEFLPYIPLT